MDKATARSRLGLPANGPVLLLAPGSGALGSVDTTARAALDVIRRDFPSWSVAVTRQAIAKHAIVTGDTSIHVLDDVYPLSGYLSAFDAAVSAAGYNAVHELLGSNVPTLFIPSTAHKTDDQVARAEGVAELGLALCTVDEVPEQVSHLLHEATLDRLSSTTTALGPMRGARVIAAEVAALAQAGTPLRTGDVLMRPPRTPLLDLRTTALDRADNPVLVTESLTREMMLGPRPVEHIIAGASETYRARRALTAHWLYR
ncbi:glycosyltransferase [Ruania halotolerans]|uniref:glycosyltransferase n=1 Tax=Ruania halotolerans TaxID=2897773 RepID=UPI001E4E9B7F|nr:glycosyltransferase [Ruania halotolerans]UFU07567.1 hypothetical protein LQF10_05550 [Ruania halotolerans]